VATDSTEVDDIRRQMAQLRMTLHHDMRGVVAGAEAATDWRYYVGLYPWACLAAAFGAGFLLVPARRRSIHKTVEAAAAAVAEKVQDNVAAKLHTERTDRPRRPSLFGTVLAFLAPMAVRAAQNLAAQYVENILARQGVSSPSEPSEPSEPMGKARY
jgi:hypothetical protein